LDDLTSLQTGPRGPNGPGDTSALGWAPIEIELAADETLTISYKDNVYFCDKIGIVPFVSRLVIGGRTGTFNSVHHIDNLTIAMAPPPPPLDEDRNGNGVPDSFDTEPTPGIASVRYLNSTNSAVWALTTSEVLLDGSTKPLDLNGDTLTDAATIYHAQQGMGIHFGTNAGTLPESYFLAVGDANWTIEAGDLDGQNGPDLVVASISAPNIQLLLNDGSGGVSVNPAPVGTTQFSDIALADFDNDLDLDIALIHFSTLVVLENNGSGAVAATHVVPNRSGYSIAVGDFDGDELADIATLNRTDLCVCRNMGGFSFEPLFSKTIGRGLPPRFSDKTIISTDLDQDGDVDLVAALAEMRQVVVLNNAGKGSVFLERVFPAAIEVAWLRAADVNADGFTDIVGIPDGANPAGDSVGLFFTRGSTELVHAQYFGGNGISYNDGQASMVDVIDVDHDGLLDIVIPHWENPDGGINVLFNRPTDPFSLDCNLNGIPDEVEVQEQLTFTQPQTYGVGTEPATILATAVQSDNTVVPLRLNDDPWVDLATGNEVGGSISVLLNAGENGAGSFLGFEEFDDYDTDPNGGPTGLAAGDLDEDGDIDLVGASVLVGLIHIFYNNGDGTFATPPQNLDGGVDNSPDVEIADFDGGGRLDLAQTAQNDNSVLVWENLGDRNYAPPDEYPVGQAPRGLAFGDVNQDGSADLVIANNGGGSVSVLRNKDDGSGTFLAHEEIVLGPAHEPFAVALADLGNDTFPELLVVDENSNLLFVLPNDGTGDFGAPDTYPVDARPRHVATVDFNQDGRLDVVVTNRDANTVIVFFNDWNGGLYRAGEFALGKSPGGAGIADFDRDGQLDLATANQQDDAVSLLLFDQLILATEPDENHNLIPDSCDPPEAALAARPRTTILGPAAIPGSKLV